MEKRKIFTLGGTLVIAAMAGHVMQNSDAIAERFSADGELPETATVTAEIGDTLAPRLPDDVPLPKLAIPKTEVISTKLAALDETFVAPSQNDAVTPQPFDLACDIKLTASSGLAAMIDLEVTAPCHGNSNFSINHEGLMFSAITDESGQYLVSFPALTKNATVEISFTDGTTVQTSTEIQNLDGYVRAALMWAGESELQIHALEFGAEYGENGHVWVGVPRDSEYGVLAKGGFLTKLGESSALGGHFAEIYSFPANRVLKAGAVRIIVEAEVTPQACGTDITGRTIERAADGTTTTVGLQLAMPECDAVGDILVLKTLFQDLMIARN